MRPHYSWPPDKEKRRHRRVCYRDPVRVTAIGVSAARPQALLADDVSESGLALHSPVLFGVGQRLLLELWVSAVDEPIRLVGLVAWVSQESVEDHYHLGVRFDSPSDHARKQLSGLVQMRAGTEPEVRAEMGGANTMGSTEAL